jgi:hypothetical protein
MLRRLIEEIKRLLRRDFSAALFLFRTRIAQAVSDLPWHIRARVITLVSYNYTSPEELEKALSELEQIVAEYEKSRRT